MSEPSYEALRIIDTAYQDMQGVLAKRKGYILRHDLLASEIDRIATERLIAELEGVKHLAAAHILDDSNFKANLIKRLDDRLTTLRKDK